MRAERWQPLLCLVMLIGLLIAAGAQWRAGVRPSADLLALLPVTARDAVEQQAAERMEQAFSSDLLLLVGVTEAERLPAQVEQVRARLQASGLFAQVQAQATTDITALREQARQQQLALLPPTDRQLLAQAPAAFLQHRLAALYDPAQAVSLIPLQDDLAGMASRALQSQPRLGRLGLDPATGLMTVVDGAHSYALIRARTRAGAFTLELPEQVADLLTALRRDLAAHGAQLLAAGGVLHGAAAKRQAEWEMSTVGSLSLIGTVLLLVLAFRRWRALLALVPVVTGLLAGWVATVAVFGEIHAMTLVFGSSLIGVAVDYALHYMSEAFVPGRAWQPWAALREVRPALLLGLVTSVLGYAALALAPFPGLRQLAVFSAAGLIVACLTVVLGLPACLSRFGHGRESGLWRVGVRLLGFRRRLTGRPAWLVAASVMALLLAGGARVHFDDNIRLLVATPPSLLAEEQQLRRLTGLAPSAGFFLVEGASADDVLRRQAQLAQRLRVAQARGELSGYLALGERWADMAQQADTRQQVLAQVFGAQARAWWRTQLGVEDAVVADNAQRLAALSPLPVSAFLAGPLGEPYRPLWLGATVRGQAGMVALQGQTAALQPTQMAAGLAGVRWVDRVAQVSELLAQTRALAMALTFAAIIVMAALLALRYGVAGALRVMAAPVAGIFAAVGLLGWLGMALNVFAVFGLVLVVAIGVDYAIFFRESHHESASTMLGVLLDVLTTLLSFGLLALSTTPAVQSFGISVALGIVCCFMFAPWVSRVRDGHQESEYGSA